jgi:hypothetical protein
MTIDNLLTLIVTTKLDSVKKLIPSRDFKVIKSIGHAITTSLYITANQGSLIIKIFEKHADFFRTTVEEIDEVLKNPVWSKPFRVIEKKRNLRLGVDPFGETKLILEFTYSADIRKSLGTLEKKLSNMQSATNGKCHFFDVTEKNIVTVIEEIEHLGFDVDETVKNWYDTIKSWSKREVVNQFMFTSDTVNHYQTLVKKELGSDATNYQQLVDDRSMRYQYFTEKSEKIPENLTEMIATRTSPFCWINRKEVGLGEIFKSLVELKRFPLMVVFDGFDANRCLTDLRNFSENLEKNGIVDNVGVYFRLENNELGKAFNQLVKDKNYNVQLDETTKVVAIQNGKIPKFFLKNSWYPMSIIAIGNSLKNNKTSVYANSCDLVINYTEQQPIIQERLKWL